MEKEEEKIKYIPKEKEKTMAKENICSDVKRRENRKKYTLHFF